MAYCGFSHYIANQIAIDLLYYYFLLVIIIITFGFNEFQKRTPSYLADQISVTKCVHYSKVSLY